jgi:hypothetical protein
MLMSLTRPRPARRDRLADVAIVDGLTRAWRSSAAQVLGQAVDGAIAGTSVISPALVEIVLGPPIELLVEMLPSQVPDDYRAVARRLAPHLGAEMLRVTPVDRRWVRLTLLDRDPLSIRVPRARPVSSVADGVILGISEEGRPVRIRLDSAAHLIGQGASGSGKSVGTYGMLAQLVDAPDVRVVGSDITGLLLGPWADRPRSGIGFWHALGTANPTQHVTVLERVVDEMDDRIANMPPGCDAIPITPDTPLILCVIEETPGLYRLLGNADKDTEKRARALVGRLLGEGRKAGVRVLMITQRADASIVGGYERGQASHTFSFRVDSLTGLQMLHSEISPDVAAEHATAEPGIALLSAPGVPLCRFGAPFTTYAQYCAEVNPTAGQEAA